MFQVFGLKRNTKTTVSAHALDAGSCQRERKLPSHQIGPALCYLEPESKGPSTQVLWILQTLDSLRVLLPRIFEVFCLDSFGWDIWGPGQ